jgi:hypothetical protein
MWKNKQPLPGPNQKCFHECSECLPEPANVEHGYTHSKPLLSGWLTQQQNTFNKLVTQFPIAQGSAIRTQISVGKLLNSLICYEHLFSCT